MLQGYELLEVLALLSQQNNQPNCKQSEH